MPALHETAYPQLKRQVSLADLQHIYTPTRAERTLAARHTKGPVARIGFLVLLKTFQRLGYFVRLAEVPEPIVEHIIACVGVPLTRADLNKYDTSGTRLRHLLDQLLVLDPTTKHTPWQGLKRDPDTPTLTHLKALLDHLSWLTTLPTVDAALAAIPDVKRKHFAAEANTLDAARMATLEPAKRATLLAALLALRTAQARDD